MAVAIQFYTVNEQHSVGHMPWVIGKKMHVADQIVKILNDRLDKIILFM